MCDMGITRKDSLMGRTGPGTGKMFWIRHRGKPDAVENTEEGLAFKANDAYFPM